MTSTVPPRYPHPAAGLVLFFAVVAVGLLGALTLPEGAVLFVMPITMLVLTGLAVAVFRVDAKSTLLLRLPARADLVMALPLAVSFFVLDDQLAALSHARRPVPEETLEYLRDVLRAQGALDWLAKIATVGIGAAVSEELMFRGFIQNAFLQRLRRPTAVALTAVLFMVLHVQFLPVLAAGIVLGFVALATRSILIPMLVHFVNNAIQLLLFNLAGIETLGEPVWISPSILLPAVAIFVLACAYYAKRLEPEARPLADDRAESERAPLVITPRSTTVSDELRSIPTSQRRLGWLVVVAAVVTGVVVLTALFGWSIYYIYPERVHERGIDALGRYVASSLPPEAAAKAPQLESAFQALSALNDRGQLEAGDLVNVLRAHRDLSADGTFDAVDADRLTETIRDIVVARSSPQKL